MTLDEFFEGHNESRRLFEAVRDAIDTVGPAERQITKSQIAFGRSSWFAFVWMPDVYLGSTNVPLVLTVGLPRRDDSPRWKQVVEPAPGRFTHHLELRRVSEVDAEVVAWLREAWEAAE